MSSDSTASLHELPPPPPAVIEFVKQLPPVAPEVADRRNRPRRLVATTCVVTPLDAHGEPSGAAFRAVTRDVSTTGIAMLFTRPVEAPKLKIQLPRFGGTTVEVLANVIRCEPLGPYYDVAGEFVQRAEATAAS